MAVAGIGISSRILALGDPEFAAVEPIDFLTSSIGHAHETPATLTIALTR